VVNKNKTGIIRIMKHRGAFVQPLLQWKPRSIVYCECVLVDLGIQHPMRIRLIAICGLSRSTFSYIISQRARFSEKKSYLTKYVF